MTRTESGNSHSAGRAKLLVLWGTGSGPLSLAMSDILERLRTSVLVKDAGWHVEMIRDFTNNETVVQYFPVSGTFQNECLKKMGTCQFAIAILDEDRIRKTHRGNVFLEMAWWVGAMSDHTLHCAILSETNDINAILDLQSEQPAPGWIPTDYGHLASDNTLVTLPNRNLSDNEWQRIWEKLNAQLDQMRGNYSAS